MFDKGSLVALVTPFDNDDVDYESLHKLIQYQIDGGTMGIVLFGTTGESPTLSKYEKIQILSYVTENFLGKISIVVGIGGNDTFSVIEFAKECYTICSKISAFMVTVPNYNKPSQEGIFQHFKTISNNVMFPIMMYNIPSRCGVNMTPHTITKLYNECDNIVAIKEASGSWDQVCEIKTLCNIKIYAGDDSMVFPIMKLGGYGVVSVLGNLEPKIISELVKYLSTDRTDVDVNKMYITLYPMMKKIFIETNPQPMKYLLKEKNIIKTDDMRLPMIKMTDLNNINELNKCYKEMCNKYN
tara:strand:+ start:112 stop:1005 length:894 start_codon:yes stop_codon:yes gene_type:complete